jgi:hypothetical protein
MKKTLLFLSILILGITSCTKTEYIEPEPALNPNMAYVVELPANGWERVSNSEVKFDIPMRDLDAYIMGQGNVSVALSFDNEESYEVLPTTFDGFSYSINYGIGWITITKEDPLAEDVAVPAPNRPVVAKIVLSETDYIDYQGLFNSPTPGVNFQKLELK